jgi:predicted ATPase
MQAMAQDIRFKNYRAFKQGRVEFRNLTILMGVNGSGKTSILYLPLLLHQSTSSDGFPESTALRINGAYCSFGPSQNLFFGKDHSKDLEFSFLIPKSVVSNFLNKTFTRANRYLAEANHSLALALRYTLEVSENHSGLSQGVKSLTTRVLRHYREQREDWQSSSSSSPKSVGNEHMPALKEAIDLYEQLKLEVEKVEGTEQIGDVESQLFFHDPDYYNFKRASNNKRRTDFGRTTRSSLTHGSSKISATDLEKLTSFLLCIRNYVSDFIVSYQISKQNDRIVLNSISLFYKNGETLTLMIKFSVSDDGTIVDTELEDADFLTHYKAVQNDIFKGNELIFRCMEVPDTNILTVKLLARWLHMFEEYLVDQYQKPELIPIKPLRGIPQRYYDAYGSNIKDDVFDIIEALKSDNQVKQFINRWVKRFGIEMEALEFEEFLGKIVTKKRISNGEIKVDLIDSGFGYSQVLPILYRVATADPNSRVLIEQPEIHLHPRMQAELAEFFIESLSIKRKDGDFRLIIETHSEHLVQRISRRVGEGAYQIDGQSIDAPKPNEISLYFTEEDRRSGGAQIRQVELGAFGEIEWPSGFFASKNEDLKAILSNRMKGIAIKQDEKDEY